MGFGVGGMGLKAVAFALLVVWAAAAPPAAQAQRPLQVRPLRDLLFGDVFPGVSKGVSRLDPTNSGHLEVRGEGGREVVFTFTLPAALVAGGGQTLAVSFGTDDGGFAETNVQASSVGFDPRVPYTNRFAANNRAFVWLGGIVLPAGAQTPGPYSATVTLTVAYTGN
ncbi:MAG: DUF4402 domain-containing protein [Gemmatimonadetes bacterium]|nr:DUF4402 domain-containing protein [Gemmatimonadota bacterium]